MTAIKLKLDSPFNFFLNTESGDITLSTNSHSSYEEIDVDVYCGANKRESLHGAQSMNGQLSSGPIARCADNAAMSLKWRLTDFDVKVSSLARHGSWSLKIPPDLLSGDSATKTAPEAPAQFYVIDTLTESKGSALQNISAAIPEIGETAILADYIGFYTFEDDPIREEAVNSFPEFAGDKPWTYWRTAENSVSPGKEPIWAAMRQALQGKWVDTKASGHKIVVLGDSEWGLITKPGNAEPLEIAQIAREKGVEVEIRGAGAVVYELAQMVVNGAISRTDYDAVVQVESGECRIAWRPFLKLLDKVGDQAELAQLYLDYVGKGNARVIVHGDLNGAPREVLDAASLHHWQTKDPKLVDMIFSALNDPLLFVRLEAVKRLTPILADSPSGLFPPEKLIQYGNGLAALLEGQGTPFDDRIVRGLAGLAARRDLPVAEKHRYAAMIARQLDSKDERTRFNAMEGLIKAALSFEQESDQHKYLDQVAQLMDHESSGIRHEAMRLLGGALQSDSALNRLGRYADQIASRLHGADDKDRQMARSALNYRLIEFSDPNRQVQYTYAIFSSDPIEDFYTYQALPQDVKVRVYDEAVKQLHDKDPQKRGRAITALRNLSLLGSYDRDLIRTWLPVAQIVGHLQGGRERDGKVVRAAEETLTEMTPHISTLDDDRFEGGFTHYRGPSGALERWFEQATWEERTRMALAFARFVPQINEEGGPKLSSWSRWKYLEVVAHKMDLTSVPILSGLGNLLGITKQVPGDYMEAALKAYIAISPTVHYGWLAILGRRRLNSLDSLVRESGRPDLLSSRWRDLVTLDW